MMHGSSYQQRTKIFHKRGYCQFGNDCKRAVGGKHTSARALRTDAFFLRFDDLIF